MPVLTVGPQDGAMSSLRTGEAGRTPALTRNRRQGVVPASRDTRQGQLQGTVVVRG